MAIEFETPGQVSVAAATCLATFAVVLFLFSRRLHRPTLKLPPGPKPWPIVGNLNLIGPLPHQSLHALSRKHGPIMQLWFGSIPVIVGSSVEIAKAFLKTHDITFASRPKTAAGKNISYNYSDILWAPYGPHWRQARKICYMHLFSAKSVECYEYIRKEERSALMMELFNSANRPILLRDHLSNLTLNIISRMVLGKKYVEETEFAGATPQEFREMLDEFFLLGGFLNIGDLIPWINFLDLQGYIRRMKALSKKFDRFLEYVLEEHNERIKGARDYVAKDIVDVLLQLAADPTLEVKLERHCVKAFIQDLLAGGTESSASTIEWAISDLLKNPKTLKKAKAELDRVIGRERWVEESDIVNLPYIDAIVKESMRLHPVAPMLAPRVAREDCNVGGYDIPKGTQVLVNMWTIGRDPTIWENPNEFLPERFIGRGIDVKGHDFEFLPFGAGRRMCPGYSLGLKVIQASVANLLHGFNWRLPDRMTAEELNMEEKFRLATCKKVPLVAIVDPRLPFHLYSL